MMLTAKLMLSVVLATLCICSFDIGYVSFPVTKQMQASLILLNLFETGSYSTLQEKYIWTDRALFVQVGQTYYGIVFGTEATFNISTLRYSGAVVGVLLSTGSVLFFA